MRGLKDWLMGAMLVVSSVALLGTSDDSPPNGMHATVTHLYARDAIDGGSVQLSEDQPSATFYVVITATALDDGQLSTTNDATATIDAVMSAKDLKEGGYKPKVSVNIGSPENGLSADEALDSLTRTIPLTFVGNCGVPTEGSACKTRFEVTVTRLDLGANGGTLSFDWTFGLASSAQVDSYASNENSSVGPIDPPWKVEVSKP